jgi:multiple sugar transport system substrate-binding protein
MTAILLAGAVAGLSGCGDNDNLVGNPNSAVKMTIAIQGAPSESNIIKAFLKKFVEENDVSVQLESFRDSYNESMFRWISGENLPDIVWTGGENHRKYSGDGVFLNLKSFIERDGFDTSVIYDNILDSAKINYSDDDSDIYFMPRDYNQVVIVYNKSMFDLAGIAYPENDWTWGPESKEGSFLNIAKRMREAMDSDDYMANTGLISDSHPMDLRPEWSAMNYGLIRGFGGDVFDGEGNYILHQTGGRLAQELENILDKRYCINPADRGSSNPMLAKRAAMAAIVRPQVSALFGKGLSIDFVSFPAMDAHVIPTGCSGYAINARISDDKKELAWEFLKHVVSVEGQNAFGALGDGVPVREDLAANGEWRNYKKENNINNDAFVSYQDKAIDLNYTNAHAPEKASDINDVVNGWIWDIAYGYPETKSREGSLQKSAQNMQLALM